MKKGEDHYLSNPVDADQILAVYASLRVTAADSAAPDAAATLARVEWEQMQRVIADCNGNVSPARGYWGLIGGRCIGN